MVEVEVSAINESLYFRPLMRTVRGRFDLAKVGEPMAKIAAANWPLAIPGQRLGIDREGHGYVIETLHAPPHAPIKEKIAASGAKLEPAVVTFENVDVCTWAYWLARAVESGLCTIVSGELPKVAGKPRMNFILAEAEPTSGDKLTAALDRQTAAFEALTAAITKLVTK